MPGTSGAFPRYIDIKNAAFGVQKMTYSAPPADYYDDGLVHSHEWSRATPPGGHPSGTGAVAAPVRGFAGRTLSEREISGSRGP